MRTTPSHHEHLPNGNRRGNFERVAYETRLEAGQPYVIDTDQPIDTEVQQPYFACAVINANNLPPDARDNPTRADDTFLVVNIKQLQPRTFVNSETGETTTFKLFNQLVVPGDSDMLLLAPNFDPTSDAQQGWMSLAEGDTLAIGRTTEAEQHLAMSPLMSREHFSLSYQDGELSITDSASSNGTNVYTAVPLQEQMAQSAEMAVLNDELQGDEVGYATKQHIIETARTAMENNETTRQALREIANKLHPDRQRHDIPETLSTDEQARLERRHAAIYRGARRLVDTK